MSSTKFFAWRNNRRFLSRSRRSFLDRCTRLVSPSLCFGVGSASLASFLLGCSWSMFLRFLSMMCPILQSCCRSSLPPISCARSSVPKAVMKVRMPGSSATTSAFSSPRKHREIRSGSSVCTHRQYFSSRVRCGRMSRVSLTPRSFRCFDSFTRMPCFPSASV